MPGASLNAIVAGDNSNNNGNESAEQPRKEKGKGWRGAIWLQSAILPIASALSCSRQEVQTHTYIYVGVPCSGVGYTRILRTGSQLCTCPRTSKEKCCQKLVVLQQPNRNKRKAHTAKAHFETLVLRQNYNDLTENLPQHFDGWMNYANNWYSSRNRTNL